MTQILFTIEHCNYSCLMRKNQHFKLPYGKINILKSFFVNEIYLIFSENRKIAFFQILDLFLKILKAVGIFLQYFTFFILLQYKNGKA